MAIWIGSLRALFIIRLGMLDGMMGGESRWNTRDMDFESGVEMGDIEEREDCTTWTARYEDAASS